MRYGYERMREAAKASRDHGLDSKRSLGLAAIESQRKRLEELRSQDADRPRNLTSYCRRNWTFDRSQ